MATTYPDEKSNAITPEPESELSQAGDTNTNTPSNTRRTGFVGFLDRRYSWTRDFLETFKPFIEFLQLWGILVFHLIFVALLATCVLIWVPGLHVNAGNTRSKTTRQVLIFGDEINTKAQATYSVRYWILPGDITTIVSTGIVFVKLATGSWAGITAWRCVCIMLEKQFLTFTEIKFMVSYRMGCLPREKHSWTVLIILLLLLPAQFSGPLVSGSISWKQSMGFVSSKDLGVYPSSGGDPIIWREYIADSDTRVEVVSEALSFSWSLYHDTSDNEDTGCRRPIMDKDLKDSAMVGNITIPCLRFDSIRWEQELPSQQVLNTFTRPYLGALVENMNPIHHKVTGNTGMVDLPQWNGLTVYHDSLPPPTIFNEPCLVAFLFAIVPLNQTCSTMYFDPQTGTKSAVFQLNGEVKHGCYTFARVSFTAGTTFSEAKVVSPGVVQGLKDAEIIANEFTRESVFLMNDLMYRMALGDPDQNVSNHTSAIILIMQRAYVSAWNSMQYNFGDNNGERAQGDLMLSDATQRVDLLEGVVTYWRVWMWVGLNLLVTVSGILLSYFQHRWCQREPKEKSFAADALLLDTADVLNEKSKRRAKKAAEKGKEAGEERKAEQANTDGIDLTKPLRVRLAPPSPDSHNDRHKLVVFRPPPPRAV